MLGFCPKQKHKMQARQPFRVHLHPQSLRDCACYVELSSPLGFACIRSPEGLRMLRRAKQPFRVSDASCVLCCKAPCWGALRLGFIPKLEEALHPKRMRKHVGFLP
jgi:hypothetical protein